jgi:thiamine pyrophosphate-dependent acetolactate synthase large subunit-like protein
MKYVLAFMIYFVSLQGFAYDSTDSFEVARNKLLNTDCSVSQNDCRYYAAIEYVAFANACLVAMEYKFKSKVSEEEIQEVNSWIENWKAIEEPQMHSSVLSKSNPFKEKILKDTITYLKNSPVDDVGIECTRLAAIKENQMPEGMSDLIAGTKNYKQWYEPIRKKKQQEFTENQERLYREAKEKTSK